VQTLQPSACIIQNRIIPGEAESGQIFTAVVMVEGFAGHASDARLQRCRRAHVNQIAEKTDRRRPMENSLEIIGFTVRLKSFYYRFLLLLDMLSALLYYLPITYTGDAAMTTKISTADVRKNFSNIVNRVSFGKESIILTRRGEEIAALVAMDELRLLQELEDRIDISDANKAIKEQGEDIPAEQFWKKLGL